MLGIDLLRDQLRFVVIVQVSEVRTGSVGIMLPDLFSPPEMVLLASVHAFATLYMCGLIWFVQVVHYPLHGLVGNEGFTRYQTEHVRRTGWVVMGPMLVELLTAVLLVINLPVGALYSLPIVGLLLLVKAWVGTAFLSVPAHRQLERGFSQAAHFRLVRTNWIRTFAWTIRAPIALAMLVAVAGDKSL